MARKNSSSISSLDPFSIQAYIPMANIYPSDFYDSIPKLANNFYAYNQFSSADLTEFMLQTYLLLLQGVRRGICKLPLGRVSREVSAVNQRHIY